MGPEENKPGIQRGAVGWSCLCICQKLKFIQVHTALGSALVSVELILSVYYLALCNSSSFSTVKKNLRNSKVLPFSNIEP